MTEQISMIELFSGIGAQERALRQFGLPYEVRHTCDCDKDAVLSYAAMRWNLEKEMETFDFPSQEQMVTELQEKNLGYDFQKGKHTITSRTPIDKLKQYYIADKLSKNLGDISKVEKLPYADFVTYSYPCTDLSVAGKGEGMVNKCDKCGCTWAINFEDPKTNNICPDCGNIDIKSTRSGLLGQVQRLLTVSYEEGTLPRYLLLENVKNLVGKKFKPQFDAWINWLDLIGYNTYYKVLNGKHYGIPQNRERIFAISIRKDVDTKGYTFPEQIPLEMRLKDILEKNVDEKYYLPDERIEKILNSTFMQEKKRIQTTDVCDTLLARDWKDPKCVPVEELEPVRIGGLYDSEEGRHQAGAIWDKDAISPTLDTMQGGNRQPFIIDEIKVVGNYMPSNHDASRVVDIDGIAPTVKENHGTVTAIAEPQIIKAGQLDCSFDQSGRVYDPEGIAPTIMSNSHGKTSGGYTSPKIVVSEPNTCLIQPKDRNYKEKNQPREVHIESKSDGVSHALRTNGETMVIEPFIVASRGRNPENPSDRTTGAPTEQRLEPNFSGCTNTLTSVQKDNYVAEPIVYDDYNSRVSVDQDAINTLTCNCGASAERNGVKIIEPVIVEDFYQSREPRVYTEAAPTIRSERVGLKTADGKIELEVNPELVGGVGEKNFGKQYRQGNRVYNSESVAMALGASPVGNTGGYSYLYAVEEKIKWRIRKLTDKECWRLMNFSDSDNDRASSFVSASSLYKQAGNSIIVGVLIAIMSSLFIEDGYKSEVWTKYILNYND